MRGFMEDNSIEVSVSINASPSKAWQALINLKMVKQYLFGTKLSTDWNMVIDAIKNQWSKINVL